jgi:hypothetical protein
LQQDPATNVRSPEGADPFRHIETQRFRPSPSPVLSCLRPKVVNGVCRFGKGVTSFERLGRLAVQFEDNRSFQNVHKPRRGMRMSPGFGCYIADPNIHLATLELRQIKFEKVCSLMG